MSDGDTNLSFDRASFKTPGDAAMRCTSCKGPLGDTYWRWLHNVVCAKCRDKLAGTLTDSQSNKRLLRAALEGGLTALGCGIAYAVFVGVTHYQVAFVTIGIAYLIARVVRKASAGIGGTRFQILAVALTYLAATMGYVPGIWKGLQHASAEKRAAKAANVATGEARDTASAPRTGPAAAPAADDVAAPAAYDARDDAQGKKPKASFGGLIVAIGALVGIMLAAPFLEATSAPLGLLIVGFGLWEAWRRSRGPPLTVEGPFRVAASPPAGPAA